MANHNYTS